MNNQSLKKPKLKKLLNLSAEFARKSEMSSRSLLLKGWLMFNTLMKTKLGGASFVYFKVFIKQDLPMKNSKRLFRSPIVSRHFALYIEL